MTSPSMRPLEGIRVLVVEDDPRGAKLLRIVLEQAGAEVALTASARQVARKVGSFDPRLVLVDLVLPDGNGLDVIVELRPRVARGELVVIVISSLNGPDTERCVHELGCAAYFRKPIETATFAQAVAGYLGGDNGRGDRCG